MRDKMISQISNLIRFNYEKKASWEIAKEILSIPELAIVDRGAQPPIRFIHPDASGVLSYEQCKKDMLKTGWVREIKK